MMRAEFEYQRINDSNKDYLLRSRYVYGSWYSLKLDGKDIPLPTISFFRSVVHLIAARTR